MYQDVLNLDLRSTVLNLVCMHARTKFNIPGCMLMYQDVLNLDLIMYQDA